MSDTLAITTTTTVTGDFTTARLSQSGGTTLKTQHTTHKKKRNQNQTEKHLEKIGNRKLCYYFTM